MMYFLASQEIFVEKFMNLIEIENTTQNQIYDDILKQTQKATFRNAWYCTQFRVNNVTNVVSSKILFEIRLAVPE